MDFSWIAKRFANRAHYESLEMDSLTKASEQSKKLAESIIELSKSSSLSYTEIKKAIILADDNLYRNFLN